MLDSRVVGKTAVIIVYGSGQSKTCGDINDYLKLFNLTAYIWSYYIYTGIPGRDINIYLGEPIISYYDSPYSPKVIYGFHKT